MAVLDTGERSLEARTIRKLGIRIVPFLMALYFVNYLDRTNLGIARADISAHLQLTATMFGLASGIFFIGYVLVEVPSNLALDRYGARRWLARIAVSWGIVVVATGFAPNVTTLLVLRFLLGVAEAGLFPGVIYYLSRWFPRDYRARVVALFMMASPIAAALGTPLAAWLIHLGNGVFGLAGWQFMMIAVGVPAIVLGFACWYYLVDRPGDAAWLEPDERQWLVDTLAEEARQVAGDFHFPLRRALTSPRIWALALVYFGIAYGLYALTFFLPSIISGFKKSFGIDFSIVQVGLIAAIPYTCAAVAMYLWSRHADAAGEHVWHVAVPMLLGGLAIPVALHLHTPVLVMVAVAITAMGVFAAIPSFWALPSNFLTGTAAAGAIGLINSVGNLGGFAAPYLTGALEQVTGTDKAGMWAVGAMMLMSAFVVVLLRAVPGSPTAAERPN
ncbi:MFS transporter [Mycobacterium marinum]|uniref:MFS transporter n=1 Tax=Mycobacterium marinum TaxID=1781 RepID=UPI000E3E1F75|nr:MFS transporter [Mycobacterium marinum]RFZ36928.1 putative tartrate transporter [Mycobacterium marinum]GJP08917.1 MFS transporter [Mycobacterium marinum]